MSNLTRRGRPPALDPGTIADAVPAAGFPALTFAEPVTLPRVGGIVTLAGFVLLVPTWVPDLGAAPAFVAVFLVGAGLGLVMPGDSAGPPLPVTREEQGGPAGPPGATSAPTFVIARTAGTSLYGVHPTPQWPPARC